MDGTGSVNGIDIFSLMDWRRAIVRKSGAAKTITAII